jgi:hypothetical protein
VDCAVRDTFSIVFRRFLRPRSSRSIGFLASSGGVFLGLLDDVLSPVISLPEEAFSTVFSSTF